jgi:hypothetical protein
LVTDYRYESRGDPLSCFTGKSGEGTGLTSTLTTFPFLSMCTCPSVTSRQSGMRYNMQAPTFNKYKHRLLINTSTDFYF